MNLSFILLAIKEMFYVNLSPHVKPRANYKISEKNFFISVDFICKQFGCIKNAIINCAM